MNRRAVIVSLVEVSCAVLVCVWVWRNDRRCLERAPRHLVSSIGRQVVTDVWVTNNEAVRVVWQTNVVPGVGLVPVGTVATNRLW